MSRAHVSQSKRSISHSRGERISGVLVLNETFPQIKVDLPTASPDCSLRKVGKRSRWSIGYREGL